MLIALALCIGSILYSTQLSSAQLSSAQAVAEDWSRFRGPGGAGRAPSGESYPRQLEAPDAVRWKVEVPPGHSSPIAVGDAVYLTAYLEEPAQLLTLAYDAATGSARWRASIAITKPEPCHPLHGPASSTPTSDGKRIFAAFGSFGVVAYDLAGKELWRAERTLRPNLFGAASSLIVADQKLIVFAGCEDGSSLEALDPTTGKLLWHRRTEGAASSWSTPTPWMADQVPALLIYEPFHMRAIALDDGRVLWSVPGLADEPITCPQVRGTKIYTTSYNLRTNREAIGLPTFDALLKECDQNGDDAIDATEAKRNQTILSRPDADGQGDHPLRMFFRMLDEDRDGSIQRDEWPLIQKWMEPWNHANGILALEVGADHATPELRWQHENGVPECPTPILVGDHLFAIRNGGVLTCLQADSGALAFQERLTARGPYYASPVASDAAIYCASERGSLSVVAADATFKLIATRDLGAAIYATPALLKGHIFVRTVDHLWAF